MKGFSDAERRAIVEAVGKDDYDLLARTFPEPFRRGAAAKEADRLRAEIVRDAAAMPPGRAGRIREAVIRDLAVVPVVVDRSQVLESYDDGTTLERDAPGTFTGSIVADRTAHRDHG